MSNKRLISTVILIVTISALSGCVFNQGEAIIPISTKYITPSRSPEKFLNLFAPVGADSVMNQSPAFGWTYVVNATKYEFQLSSTVDFSSIIYKNTTEYNGTVVPQTCKLERGKQYFWRVRVLEPSEGKWVYADFSVATLKD